MFEPPQPLNDEGGGGGGGGGIDCDIVPVAVVPFWPLIIFPPFRTKTLLAVGVKFDDDVIVDEGGGGGGGGIDC